MVSASNQWCFQIPALANVGLSGPLYDDSCVVSNVHECDTEIDDHDSVFCFGAACLPTKL